MIELDNSIMSSDELMNKIRVKILNKGINENEHYKESGNIRKQVTITKNAEIHTMLESAKRNCNILDTTWFYDGISVNSPNPIKVFLKRVMRKSHYWFLKPFWEQQNNFNGAATRAIEDMLKVQIALLDKLEEK